MTTEQLTIFIKAAQCLNFSDVAKRCYVSQPLISRQINALEQQLGVPLFIRNGNRLRLTMEGEAFLPEAWKVLNSITDATQKVQHLHSGQNGSLLIGVAAASFEMCLHCVREFNKLETGIVPTVSELSGSVESDLAKDIAYDFLFAPSYKIPNSVGQEMVTISTDSLYLVVPEVSPIKALPEDFTVLADLPFIFFDSYDQFSTVQKAVCENRGFVPIITRYTNHVSAMLISIAAGKGCSILPGGILRLLNIKGYQSYPIPGDDCIVKNVVAWNKALPNPAANRFLDLLRSIYPNSFKTKQ